jgi:broad specificity phosphatase PhoE
VNWLLLIKHSQPAIDASVPAATWALSEEGRRRCAPLAQRVAEYAPDVVVCSLEPKASETGRLLAEQLNIPWQSAPNLHEHERPQAGWFSRQEFESRVEMLFMQPDQLVFGAETALQAQARFSVAVESVLEKHPGQNVAVVAHGTVISLLVAEKTGMAAFPLWQKLGLPSLVVLSRPDFKLEKVIENV